MSDVVPLAVAFQEVCHAMFNGSEENKCQTRLIGDMMVSFPAGIVQVVANNPNPSPLSFKIKNADVLESIVPNTKLITPSEMLSTPNGKVFEFKMEALKELLKVQSEMNPNAAYFNIDLLKYQVSLAFHNPQCGNKRIFLLLIIYVKSYLVNLESRNLPF